MGGGGCWKQCLDNCVTVVQQLKMWGTYLMRHNWLMVVTVRYLATGRYAGRALASPTRTKTLRLDNKEIGRIWETIPTIGTAATTTQVPCMVITTTQVSCMVTTVTQVSCSKGITTI